MNFWYSVSAMKKLTDAQIKSFRKTVLSYYAAHGRHTLAWRHTTDPYKILVSEVMLQQTQVDRVKIKYAEFIKTFPSFKALAKAQPREVLAAWSGLGYNRRALYLFRTAQVVIKHKHAPLHEYAFLRTLPGIGPNTAGAIMTYAFNQPVVFIETNVRSVFIHHFFTTPLTRGVAAKGGGGVLVSDSEILPLIEQTLDRKNPREWYWAIMDYGVFLKKQFKNPSRASAHHTKQSKFEGSNRQLRGKILKLLLSSSTTTAKLTKALKIPKTKIAPVLAQLVKDGLVSQSRNALHL